MKTAIPSLFLAILIFLFLPALHAQIFVTPAGGGSADGSSWANAIAGSQLRARMLTASAGTQFWLAAGTTNQIIHHPILLLPSSRVCSYTAASPVRRHL